MLERKKNNISNNYSFDKEASHTLILNDNKNNNNIENNSIIENLKSFNNKSDKNQSPNIICNDNNIVLSKENLNNLFLKNLKENIKNYKISNLEICLINNKDKKIKENETKETNEIDLRE